MRRLIEDYAFISDMHTGALVGNDGSIDWLCLPRFDSDAAFCALLGTEENGRWSLAPSGEVVLVERQYRGDSLILETTMHTKEGSVTIVDFMPRRKDGPTLVRLVRGLSGKVAMHTKIACRFSYGRIPPWIRPSGDHFALTVGPDAVTLRSSVPLEFDVPDLRADFDVAEGDEVSFLFQFHSSRDRGPRERDANELLDETEQFWNDWSGKCSYRGPYRRAVVRSLVTLKGLIYAPSGGSAAALTTSLPEQLAGPSNWDYRYAWIRDSAFTVDALVNGGYHEEARAWRDWLLRVLAGEPGRLQIMYSVEGNRRLEEHEADWLLGYEGSAPVRVGNAAYEQFQLGIYGHLMQAIFTAHDTGGVSIDDGAWAMLRRLVEHVIEVWRQPDDGIWEYREKPAFYTTSRVMAWVALDFAVRAVEEQGYDGPADRWRRERDEIAEEVSQRAFNYHRNAFVESYGSNDLDASLLLMPLVGFIKIDDKRYKG
ncbi:MAG: glycoside hydrolase family 15 protein, partial [Vulcanimicrobiaceae bacterium]